MLPLMVIHTHENEVIVEHSYCTLGWVLLVPTNFSYFMSNCILCNYVKCSSSSTIKLYNMYVLVYLVALAMYGKQLSYSASYH